MPSVSPCLFFHSPVRPVGVRPITVTLAGILCHKLADRFIDIELPVHWLVHRKGQTLGPAARRCRRAKSRCLEAKAEEGRLRAEQAVIGQRGRRRSEFQSGEQVLLKSEREMRDFGLQICATRHGVDVAGTGASLVLVSGSLGMRVEGQFQCLNTNARVKCFPLFLDTAAAASSSLFPCSAYRMVYRQPYATRTSTPNLIRKMADNWQEMWSEFA